MALIWKQRAFRLKERKQKKLLVAQKRLENEIKQSERRIEQLQARAQEHRDVAVEARKQETSAKTHVDRRTNNGLAPEARHLEMLEEAKKIADAANRQESAVLKRITEVEAVAPEVSEVPEVPPVEEVVLSKVEILSVLLFILLDALHLNKWVALAIVGVGAAAFFLAEKQGWVDFINF
jgi:hypothetical protein